MKLKKPVPSANALSSHWQRQKTKATVMAMALATPLWLSLGASPSWGQTVPLTSATFSYHPQAAYALGKGLDVDHPEQEKTFCGEFEEINVDGDISHAADISTTLARTTSEVRNKLGFDARIEARYLFGSGSLRANYENQTTVDESGISLVVKGENVSSRRMLRNFRLKPEFQRLLEQPSGVALFRAVCGTHYVTTVHRGHKLAIIATMTNLSRNERTILGMGVNAAYNGGLAGGSINANFISAFQNSQNSSRITFRAFSNGGTGLPGFAAMIPAVVTNNFELPRLAESMQATMRTFTDATASPLAVMSMPYVGVALRIANLSNTERDAILGRLVERHRNQTQLVSTLEESFRNLSQLRNQPDLVALKNRCIPAMEHYCTQLAAAHQRCSNGDLTNMERDCDITRVSAPSCQPELLTTIATVMRLAAPANSEAP